MFLQDFYAVCPRRACCRCDSHACTHRHTRTHTGDDASARGSEGNREGASEREGGREGGGRVIIPTPLNELVCVEGVHTKSERWVCVREKGKQMPGEGMIRERGGER